MATSWEKIKDNRKEITDKVIKAMQEEGLDWIRPWQAKKWPYNPVSEKKYRGGNVIRLWIAAEEKQYQDPRWCTYIQAQSKGWKVKKGEHGTLCEYWNKKQIEVENQETGEVELQEKPICNVFYLYNAEQLEGIEALPPAEKKVNEEYNQIADDLIASSECPIIESAESDEAYYQPKLDRIVLPDRTMFYETEGFAETLLHEMAHSTGHPSRLNRESIAKYIKNTSNPIVEDHSKIDNYPIEELVAEISSVMMCNDLGIDINDQMMKNHAAYLNSWISELKNDSNALFKAMSAADTASDRILENYHKMVASKEAKEKLSIEYFLPQETFEEFCERYKFELPSREEMQEMYSSLENLYAALDPEKYYRTENLMKMSKAYAESIETGKILGRMVVKEIEAGDIKTINNLIDLNIKTRNFDTVSALYNLLDHGKYVMTEKMAIHMNLRHSYDDLKAAGTDKAKAMEIYQYTFGCLKPEMIPALHQLVQQKPDTNLETYIDLAVSGNPEIIRNYIKNRNYELTEEKQALADYLKKGEEFMKPSIEEHWKSFVGKSIENPAASLEFSNYEKGEFTVRHHGGPNSYMEYRGKPEEIAETFHFGGQFKEKFFDMEYLYQDTEKKQQYAVDEDIEV